jgi:hypothetical protein
MIVIELPIVSYEELFLQPPLACEDVQNYKYLQSKLVQ